MKKTIIILNLILAMLVIVGDICYTMFGGLWLKGLTSLGFVLIGTINLFYAVKVKSKNIKFCIVMVIGLILSMLGDIVLNIYFIGGAILFALGHVAFVIAYCYLKRFKVKDLIPILVIAIPSSLIITLVPIFDFGGILMQLVCLIYALIISCMVGKSVSNYFNDRTFTNLIIMIGSFLFFFSDLMLLFDVFANVSIVFGLLCLASYYPAQILLSYSILHQTLTNKKDLN